MPVAGEIELRNRAFCLSRSQRLAALAAVVVPPVLLVVVVLLMLAGIGGGTDPQSMEELAAELRTRIWKELAGNVVHVVLFVLTAVISAAGLLRGIGERLFVGPEGIRYFSGMPGWLGPLQGNWSASAGQIRDIRAAHSALGPAPQLVQLVIETEGKTRRLSVFSYVDAASHQPKPFRVLTRFRPDQDELAELFRSMPLVEYAQRAGYEVSLPEIPAPGANMELSLKGKPRLSIALLIVIVGFSYAIIEMGTISETYAAGAPIWLIVLGGIGVGALAWPLLGSKEVSRPARAGVAGLVAVTAMAALYPGLIRINRIGAPDPQPHAYRHDDAGTLEPVETSSPELDLPDLVDLLIGSQPGDVHELWIRRGSLGFYQIDIDALDEWIDGLQRASR